MSDAPKPDEAAPGPETAPQPVPRHRRDRAEIAAEAKHWVDVYREQYPGDARTDEVLLHAPYGGFELACLPEAEKSTIPERLKRLSRTAVVEKTAENPPRDARVVHN